MSINFFRVGIAILFACDVYMAAKAAYYASVHTAELMFVTFAMGIIAGVLIAIDVVSQKERTSEIYEDRRPHTDQCE